MAFGGAKKKLQNLAETAEKMYERLNEVRAEVDETRKAVDETHDRVVALEREVADQRALVEALARDAGIDVEGVLAEAAIEEAEPADDSTSDGHPGAGQQ